MTRAWTLWRQSAGPSPSLIGCRFFSHFPKKISKEKKWITSVSNHWRIIFEKFQQHQLQMVWVGGTCIWYWTSARFQCLASWSIKKVVDKNSWKILSFNYAVGSSMTRYERKFWNPEKSSEMTKIDSNLNFRVWRRVSLKWFIWYHARKRLQRKKIMLNKDSFLSKESIWQNQMHPIPMEILPKMVFR